MEAKTLRRPERLRHVPRQFSGPLLRRDLPCDDGGAELINCQTYCQSRLLPQQRGLSSNQIASELGIRPQTAAKYANLATFARRRGIKPASKLDLFKPAITRSPEHHPYRATRTAPPVPRHPDLSAPARRGGLHRRLQRREGLGAGRTPGASRRPGAPSRLPQPRLRSRRGRTSGLGLRRHHRAGPHALPPILLRHGPLPQPHDLRGVHLRRSAARSRSVT